jgi:predicted DNA-binding transcriptional regulator AlpA
VPRRLPPQQPPPLPRAPMHAVSTEPTAAPSRLMFKDEVVKLVGSTYVTLWRWMREDPPKFPLSFDVGGKTAWREDEVNAWIASRPRSNLKKREG